MKEGVARPLTGGTEATLVVRRSRPGAAPQAKRFSLRFRGVRPVPAGGRAGARPGVPGTAAIRYLPAVASEGIRLHYAPRTRAVRVRWLLEELDLPYELVRGELAPPIRRFFGQDTPTGKFPTLEDGDLVLCESGAIVEYLLERYGEGRLAPPPGSRERAVFLQWLHFAESTAFPPIGIVVWLTRYRGGADGDALLEDARERAASGLAFVEQALTGRSFLLGDAFSAADVMMGFTLFAAASLGLLDERFPALRAYLARLAERPALREILAEQ